jgi:hypothetical protein
MLKLTFVTFVKRADRDQCTRTYGIVHVITFPDSLWTLQVKTIPVKAMEAHRVVRRSGSQIFKTIRSQTAVRLSTLRAGHLLLLGRFLVLVPSRGSVYLRAVVKTKKQTPWSQSASELYRPSDRRFSAKRLPTFADRGVPRGQRDGSLRPYSRFSRQGPLHHAINVHELLWRHTPSTVPEI